MLVTDDRYKRIKGEVNRVLSALNTDKQYLVWYHHLLNQKSFADKKKARKKR